MILLKSIFFDLDGTLVDSKPGILLSCQAALSSLGNELPLELDISSIIGPPIHDVMRYLLGPADEPLVLQAVEAYRSHYSTDGHLLTKAYPHVSEMLKHLQSDGLHLYVATSKYEAFAIKILEKLGLSRFFNGIYGSVPAAGRDHKTDILKHILVENRLASEYCVMVGDRHFDIVGAHANNMKGVGVLWGYGSMEELVDCGADAITGHPLELIELVTAERGAGKDKAV